MTKKKKIIIIISAITLVLAALVVVAVMAVQHYMERNTWATIRAAGTRMGETADAFEGEQECLKGDTMSFAGVTIRITDVKHDGTVTFSVEYGKLFDENGEPVSNGKIVKKSGTNYSLGNGSVTLTVVSHRYR